MDKLTSAVALQAWPRPPLGDATLHQERVLNACRALEQSEAGLALDELARSAGMSTFHFHRVFKQVVGVTPKAYFKAVQAQRLQKTLTHSKRITDAVYDAGFNSPARFYSASHHTLGMAPWAYRQRGVGQQIRYTVQPCVLGWVLVAATPRGVCTIEFDDAQEPLIERLTERFAQAQIEPADATFDVWVQRVLSYLEHPQGLLDLPLDVQGTAFQQRVWQALRDIPSGATRSYTQVAQAIGAPTAVRAVAQACAHNPVAVAIPCHRVLRHDGQLSGYRWGVARKAQLLEQEKIQREKSPKKLREIL